MVADVLTVETQSSDPWEFYIKMSPSLGGGRKLTAESNAFREAILKCTQKLPVNQILEDWKGRKQGPSCHLLPCFVFALNELIRH